MTVRANDLHNDSPRGSIIPAGNTATGLLKLIALAFMLIDHSGKGGFPAAVCPGAGR